MANKDRCRSEFEAMTHYDQSKVKCYVKLKKQALACQFADAADSPRSNIFNAWQHIEERRGNDWDLSELLNNAANKADVERQRKKHPKSQSLHHTHTQKKNEETGKVQQ